MYYEKKSCENMDVAGLVERTDEVIFELAHCQSANMTDIKTFDRVRIDEYNAMLNRYADWVTSAPDVDMPETHPRLYAIKFISEDINVEVENKALRDLIRFYRGIINEMVRGQSSGAANGLTTHDKRRFDLIMEKIQKFLVDYVDNTQPLDMPESSPSSERVGPGLTA